MLQGLVTFWTRSWAVVGAAGHQPLVLRSDAGNRQGVLLDYDADTIIGDEILRILTEDGDLVPEDLHVWRLSPGHYGAIIALRSLRPCSPAEVKQRLDALSQLAHITVEVDCREGPLSVAPDPAAIHSRTFHDKGGTTMEGDHKHDHQHTHEHKHVHDHAHEHDGEKHSHPHEHTHEHGHAHEHSHPHSHSGEGEAHGHSHEGEHGEHDHNHADHDREAHDHSH
jgi:hypothetical protein